MPGGGVPPKAPLQNCMDNAPFMTKAVASYALLYDDLPYLYGVHRADPVYTSTPFGHDYPTATKAAADAGVPFQPFDRMTMGLATWPTTMDNCTYDPDMTDADRAAGKVDCTVCSIPSAYLIDNNLRDDNYLPNNDVAYNDNKLGNPAMQHIGLGGGSGDRYLLGYATGLSYPGRPEKFYVAEVDDRGRVYGKPTQLPADTARGEHNVWLQLPKSGCVAWPYAWKDGTVTGTSVYGDTSKNAPPGNTVGLSRTIRITTVCPRNKESPAPARPCTSNCQHSCPAGSAGSSCQFTDAKTCAGRGVAMDTGDCMCKVGYRGGQCQFTVAATCIGHGSPDDEGQCTCDDTFSGKDCSCTKSATCLGCHRHPRPRCQHCCSPLHGDRAPLGRGQPRRLRHARSQR